PLSRQPLDPGGDGDTLLDELLQRALVPGRPPVEGPAELGHGGHSAGAQLSVEDPASDLALRHSRLARRRASLRQVPEALLTVSTHDHHLALVPQEVQQHCDAAAAFVVPAPGPPGYDGAVLQIPGAER